MQPFEKSLEGIRAELSIGYETIRVYRAPDLKSLQIGYSISPTGESLTGEKEGDWLKKWIVIGYGECCGDPIFIDSTAEGFPVYTAIHGEGSWNAKRIAVSLEQFGLALSAVAEAAKGRESPVLIDNIPITESEKQTTLATIEHLNPGVDLEFWKILLGHDA